MVLSPLLNSIRQVGSRMSPRQRGTLALSIPIFCTVTMFAAWMTTRVGIRRADQWVDHTEQIISESSLLLQAVTTLESNVHRQALAGERVDRADFEQATQSVLMIENQVFQRIHDNSDQQLVWRSIQTQTQERLMLLEQFYQELQPSLLPSNSQISASTLNQGQQAMDSLRQLVQQFQNNERQLLAKRQAQLALMLKTSTLMGWSLLAGSLLSSCGALSLFWLLDTQRVQQDLELSQTQHLMATLASSVVDGVILINDVGHVIDFNRSALDMFGYRAHEVSDRALSEFLMSMPRRQFQIDFLQEQSHPVFQTHGTRKDGSQFPVELSVSNDIAQHQQILIVRDISEREAAQQRLEEYAQDLERLNQALSLSNRTLTLRNQELDQFAYLASHDLKAPLRAITNLTEWIEEDLEAQLPPENRQQFQLLRGRASRLERLIDALALYTRIGQEPLTVELVEVESLILESLQALQVPAHIRVIWPQPLPTVAADRNALKQIFYQLLDNAIKFHQGDRGTIEITAREKAYGWEFAVRDDGPGIDQAYHGKIFQIFQTLTPRDQFESIGIGLAMVSKILATVGGDIQILSAEEEGATFQFTWPKMKLSVPLEGAIAS